MLSNCICNNSAPVQGVQGEEAYVKGNEAGKYDEGALILALIKAAGELCRQKGEHRDAIHNYHGGGA